jgi:S-adenosylmethionine decarboxylase
MISLFSAGVKTISKQSRRTLKLCCNEFTSLGVQRASTARAPQSLLLVRPISTSRPFIKSKNFWALSQGCTRASSTHSSQTRPWHRDSAAAAEPASIEALCSAFYQEFLVPSEFASASAPRLPVPFFEGSEKRVEIHYVPADPRSSDNRGLRQVPRAAWAQALSKAGITIESAIYGEHWDSYMLSESSLFVSPTRIICKTCGQSAPLEILEDALRLGEELGYEAKQVLFSRSDLLRPEEQLPVHQSFDAERSWLDKMLPQAVSTNAYMLGDAGGAHWNVYSATLPTTVPEVHTEVEAIPPTLEIVCYGLEPTNASVWFETHGSTAYGARLDSGLSTVMPKDGTVDEIMFSPCGYSMNCYDTDGAHSTVHITPQEGCSFASYEATVFDLSTVDDTIRKVVEVFKPERFSVSLIEWDKACAHETSLDPTDDRTSFASQYTVGSQSSQRLTSGSSIGRHQFSSFEFNGSETLESSTQELGMPSVMKGKSCAPNIPSGFDARAGAMPYSWARTGDFNTLRACQFAE